MSEVNFKLYLITDRRQCAQKPLPEIIETACRCGVKAVQLREKDLTARELYNLALKIRAVCQATQTKLFINDRADVARAVEADGLQLTSQSVPINAARKCLNSKKLIGVSTHSFEEARLAEKSGCDFILFGPIFKTPSKMAHGKPQSIHAIYKLRKIINVPIFAVGGITPERAKLCIENGASGVAVISAIMGANNIENVVDNFKESLGGL